MKISESHVSTSKVSFLNLDSRIRVLQSPLTALRRYCIIKVIAGKIESLLYFGYMVRAFRCPLIEEIDTRFSPPDAFELFRKEPFSFFLDSGMDPHKLGWVATLLSAAVLSWYSAHAAVTSSLREVMKRPA